MERARRRGRRRDLRTLRGRVGRKLWTGSWRKPAMILRPHTPPRRDTPRWSRGELDLRIGPICRVYAVRAGRNGGSLSSQLNRGRQHDRPKARRDHRPLADRLPACATGMGKRSGGSIPRSVTPTKSATGERHEPDPGQRSAERPLKGVDLPRRPPADQIAEADVSRSSSSAAPANRRRATASPSSRLRDAGARRSPRPRPRCPP